jgi:hypothetical protein
MFEEDALNRLNQFRENLEQEIAKRDDRELLSAIVARLHTSVAKAATVLAAYEMSDTIHLLHTLVAIRQGEDWFNNAMRAFGEVSSSDFGRKADEVRTFIALGKEHARLHAEIFRRFTFKETEFNEVIGFLIRSGDIRYVQGSRQKVEVLM